MSTDMKSDRKRADRNTKAEPTSDGRTLRRIRNRQAVIDALAELIRGGDLDPSVDAIARAAQVSHRSIFRYFDDLSDLAKSTIRSELQRHAGLLDSLHEPGGELRERVERLVNGQITVYADTNQLLRVAHAKATSIPDVDGAVVWLAQGRLKRLTRQFEPELDAMEPHKRSAVSNALISLVSSHTYDLRSRGFGQSDEEIAAEWTTAIMTLLR